MSKDICIAKIDARLSLVRSWFFFKHKRKKKKYNNQVSGKCRENTYQKVEILARAFQVCQKPGEKNMKHAGKT